MKNLKDYIIKENCNISSHFKVEYDQECYLNSMFEFFGDEFPKDFYSLIVLDNFKTNKTEIDYFSEFGTVISIDEGSTEKILQKISYSLNIIPSEIKEKNINFSNYDFIPLPQTQKFNSVKSIKDIKNVIIVFGGMDKSLFALKLAQKVENEMEYPGQIKVNIIRETRTIDYAK